MCRTIAVGQTVKMYSKASLHKGMRSLSSYQSVPVSSTSTNMHQVMNPLFPVQPAHSLACGNPKPILPTHPFNLTCSQEVSKLNCHSQCKIGREQLSDSHTTLAAVALVLISQKNTHTIPITNHKRCWLVKPHGHTCSKLNNPVPRQNTNNS